MKPKAMPVAAGNAQEQMVAELLDSYIRHLEIERGVSRFTVRNYTTDIRGFLEFLKGSEDRALAEVDHPLLRRYLASLQEQGIVRASIARKLSALRSFYRYLKREGKVDSEPLAGTSTPKREQRLPHFLTTEEIARLLEMPDRSTPHGLRDWAILELLYASGLRISELVAIDLKQINLGLREIRVWGKGSKERCVLIGKPAAAALARYLSSGREELLKDKRSEALFVNRYGKRIAQRRVQLMLKRYAQQAGLEGRIFPHMLRHTFATHMLDGGADLRVVQELLGHTSLASTQVYTHITQSQTRKSYLKAYPRGNKTKEESHEDPGH